MVFYTQCLIDDSEFYEFLIQNIRLTRNRYRASQIKKERMRVGVSGWDLAHNAAGRVYTLAMLYNEFSDVEIIGCIFPYFGCDVWEPIRDTAIKKHTVLFEDTENFIEKAISLVSGNPYDILHLSKPRFPNILFGMLYKIIWGTKVFVDVDDEELALVGLDSAFSRSHIINDSFSFPEFVNIAGKMWTQIAVSLLGEFDGITVSNHTLQERYGGVIISHARDEKSLIPNPSLKNKTRNNYGIPCDKIVILFFGTPRKHKGLIQTALCIKNLNRGDVVFVIVGKFCDTKLKDEIRNILGSNCFFIDNQPISLTSEILSMADMCVLLQEDNFEVSKFQIPAKLSDALAMAVPTFITVTPPLESYISTGAFVPVTVNNLTDKLKCFIECRTSYDRLITDARSFFLRELSFEANVPKLKLLVLNSVSRPLSPLSKIILSQMKIGGKCPFGFVHNSGYEN